jgi:hypothetical protein
MPPIIQPKAKAAIPAVLVFMKKARKSLWCGWFTGGLLGFYLIATPGYSMEVCFAAQAIFLMVSELVVFPRPYGVFFPCARIFWQAIERQDARRSVPHSRLVLPRSSFSASVTF